MPRKPDDVTDAELAVLQVLWNQGQASMRELSDELYPGGTKSHYATVKKLLTRLESKDCVQCDRSGSVFQFEATIEKKDLVSRRLRAVAESLCDGSLSHLLTQMVESKELTKKDRNALRSLIDELDTPKQSKKKR